MVYKMIDLMIYIGNLVSAYCLQVFPTKYPSPLPENNQSMLIKSFNWTKADIIFCIRSHVMWPFFFTLMYFAFMCFSGIILYCDSAYLAFVLFTDPHIEKEQAEPAANRLQMACEAFGSGMLPQLQSAVYKVSKDMPEFWILSLSLSVVTVGCQSQRNKEHTLLSLYISSKIECFVFFSQLETKFRDHSNQTMSEREEPFRCVVKFESTNLLESLRHCASSGIKNHMCLSKKTILGL